jgi:peptidyl-prolyl cis-trans isomerase D
MRLLPLLALIALFVISCNNTKKNEGDFPPYTISTTSEDSTVITLSYDEYQNRLNDAKRYNKIINESNYNKAFENRLENSVFNDQILENKLKHETNHLGLTVTDAEVDDFTTGKNIHPALQQMPFLKSKNKKGYDRERAKGFIEEINSDKNSEPYFTWHYQIDELKYKRLEEKYQSLLRASFLQTNRERAWYTKLTKGISTVQLSTLPYKPYIDTIEPDDEAYLKILREKAYAYQTNEKRYFKVAVIEPKIYKHFHEQEFKTFERYLNTIDDFGKIAAQNNYIKTFSASYGEKSVPKDLKDFFENSNEGDIKGPYLEKNSFRAIKIDKKQELPEEVRARHLVIKNIDQSEIEKIKLEITTQMAEGADFLDIAKKYAEKYGKEGKWGDLEWFRHAEMVKPFSDAAFFNAPGQLVTVKTQYGWHIIEIQEHKNISKKYFFTALYWGLTPAEGDFEAAKKEAAEFAASINNPDEFVEKAVKNHYQIREDAATAYSRELEYYKNTENVVKWAFNNYKGAISSPYKIDDKIFVFQIEEINEPGLMLLREVEQYIRLDAKTELAKKHIQQDYNINELNQLSFEETAQKLGVNDYTINEIGFHQDMMPNVGTDPYVVGLIDAAKPGETSKLFFGKKGLIQFKKLEEKPIIESKDYAKLKEKEWLMHVDNKNYEILFRLHDGMTINKLRKQDSYFLVPKYDNKLPDAPELSNKMFEAEYAFRNNNYELALHGNENFKGFAELAKEKLSKQQQLAKLYAGLSALQLEKYGEVEKYLKDIQFNDRFFSVIAKGAQADALVQLGKEKEAIKQYEEAIGTRDNYLVNAAYLMKMTAIADAQGDYKKAYEYINRIIDDYPQTYLITDLRKYLARYEYLAQKDKVIR